VECALEREEWSGGSGWRNVESSWALGRTYKQAGQARHITATLSSTSDDKCLTVQHQARSLLKRRDIVTTTILYYVGFCCCLPFSLSVALAIKNLPLLPCVPHQLKQLSPLIHGHRQPVPTQLTQSDNGTKRRTIFGPFPAQNALNNARRSVSVTVLTYHSTPPTGAGGSLDYTILA